MYSISFESHEPYYIYLPSLSHIFSLIHRITLLLRVALLIDLLVVYSRLLVSWIHLSLHLISLIIWLLIPSLHHHLLLLHSHFIYTLSSSSIAVSQLNIRWKSIRDHPSSTISISHFVVLVTDNVIGFGNTSSSLAHHVSLCKDIDKDNQNEATHWNTNSHSKRTSASCWNHDIHYNNNDYPH